MVCTFKKGGKCVNHGTKGTRFIDSMKVWTKNKDGLFGYVWKTRVRYVCQNDGVAKSDVLNSRYKAIRGLPSPTMNLQM